MKRFTYDESAYKTCVRVIKSYCQLVMDPLRQDLDKPARQLRMSDIADAAGVSLATVSRVLSAPGKVTEETRARVIATVDRLGYVPDRVAGSLVSKRSHVVAVVIPTITNSLFAETVNGLETTLEASGYQLMIGSSHYSPEKEAELVRMMLSRRVDAVVLTGTTHLESTRTMLQRSDLPVFEMWNLTDDPIDTVVGFSNYKAGHAMTSYLAGRGYRRIAYLGGLTDRNDRTSSREDGYRAALEELGLGPAHVLRRPFDFRSGADGLRELLVADPGIDAVFAASDVLAAGAVFECQRQGWPIPGRVAVAGLDDSLLAAELHPSLTTVRLPRYEMGVRIGRELLGRFEQTGTGAKQIDLGFEIIERDSA